MQWYQRAADKGSTLASLALARMYQFKIDSSDDTAKASEIYQTLAKKGQGFAQYQLGLMSLQDAKTSEDMKKGTAWLTKSSGNGNKQAKQLLEDIKAKKTHASAIHVNANHSVVLPKSMPVNVLYWQALQQWNHGQLSAAIQLLEQLHTAHPDFVPAKESINAFNAVQKSIKVTLDDVVSQKKA